MKTGVLWVDKHRPRKLADMRVHPNLNERLRRVVSEGDFPNLLFYGPSGGGKKTRIFGCLREVFGGRVEHLRLQNKDITFGTRNKRTIAITTLQSPYHIEVSPSDVGTHDRHVVASLLKEIAQSIPVNMSKKSRRQGRGFKVVVLNEVDSLTDAAQAALRRTMERFSRNCKLVLCCTHLSRVIGPIRSRCLVVRVPAPSDEVVKQVLFRVARKESIRLPETLATRIASESDGNLRRAILMLESAHVQSKPLQENQTIPRPEWDVFISGIAQEIFTTQTPKRLLQTRTKFYTLIVNCIPPELILQRLCFHLLQRPNLNSSIKHKMVHWAAVFEHRLKLGTKPIFHLEAFVARFMRDMKESHSEQFQ